MRKKIREELSEIKEQLEKINKSQVFYKANQYDIMKEHLSNLKVKVKKSFIKNINGINCVVVQYDVPDTIITFDTDNLPVKNDRLLALTNLGLMDFKDENIISLKIEEAQGKNRG